MWSECLTKNLNRNQSYKRADIVSALAAGKSGLSINSYIWIIGDLVKQGFLTHVGTDRYELASSRPKSEYRPFYSDLALKIKDEVAAKYPRISFTLYENVLLNEFLNHLIGQNTVFVHAQRNISDFVFDFLKFEQNRFVLYKPSVKEFRRNWQPDAVVVLDLVSRAPLLSEAPHDVTIEKMLVDMYCDKQIQMCYSEAEYPDVIETAYERYKIDTPRLLNYAKRRNKAQEIAKFIPEKEIKPYAVQR